MWTRENNFYRDLPNSPGYGSLIREVTFKTESYIAIVKKVDIFQYKDHRVKAEITGTGFCDETILETIKKCISRDYSHNKVIDGSTFYIDFCHADDLSKLIILFSSLQPRSPCYIYNEIITELKQIILFLNTTNSRARKYFHHSIPIKQKKDEHLDPLHKDSTQLVKKIATHIPQKALKLLLSKGYNPNLPNDDGLTPLWYIVHRYSLTELELLLMYGANPFSRDNGLHFDSAIELAKECGYIDKVNLIISSQSRVDKPLQPDYQLMSNHVVYYRKQIRSEFNFKHKKIFTILSHASDLPNNTIDAISHMFFQYFDSVDTNKKFVSLEQDLHDQNKMIEIIKDGKKIIGFNVFEIIHPQQNSKDLFVHCIYALLHPQYRGYSLMTLLCFRIAFSLKLLFPDHNLGVFFTAVHYNSYKMVKNLLHYPKYQPDYMTHLVEHILNHIFSGQYAFTNEDLACYIREEVFVKDSQQNAYSDLNEKLFYHYILNDADRNEIKTRAAPVLFYVSDDSFNQLSTLLLKTLNLAFFPHIQQLAHHLPCFFNLKDKPRNEPYWPKSNFLFWHRLNINPEPTSYKKLARY